MPKRADNESSLLCIKLTDKDRLLISTSKFH